jgi:hypothetical protein
LSQKPKEKNNSQGPVTDERIILNRIFKKGFQMGFGPKTEEKRSLVRPKRRWVDNRINGYNNCITFEKVVYIQ